MYAGSEDSYNFIVSVPPEFQKVIETIHVRLNNPVTISCSAIGQPLPEMLLSKEDSNLTPVTTTNSSMSTLTYDINKPSADDLGVYTCKAVSGLGVIQKNVTLNGECFFIPSCLLLCCRVSRADCK